MSKLKDILRDAGYCTVGAAAVIVEGGSKAVKCLVRKGEKTLRENQDTVDDLKRRVKDLGDKARESIEKATAKPEKPPVDAFQLSPEARAELRRQLDEADAAREADAACEVDAACETNETCNVDEAESRPVAPDVIYHTDAPIPEDEPEAEPEAKPAVEFPDEEDKPENSPNG